MTLPNFPLHEDPGPDFTTLVKRVDGPYPDPGGDVAEKLNPPHGTTCVALRYNEGVVIAGDRRATAGNRISHRTIEKVFAADRHSAVAIAGAAGPAIEMVKLFQLQLEHYEKVEGRALSLNGKANQLGGMLRQNLPMAMQGMAVVPIFAGYDLREEAGRLFAYDVTGGRYEEREFAATGSGSLHASTVIKLQWRPEQERDDAVNVALAALFEAADEDSATGGPDLIRGIYPVVATITADGFERLEDDELAAKYEKIIADLKEREVPA